MVRCHMGPGSAAHRRRDAALRPEHESGECGPTWFDIVMASAATCPLEPLGERGSNPESLRSGSLQAHCSQTHFCILAAHLARAFASLPCPRLNKGAGKAGSRLAPVDRHAKSRLRVLRIAENRATGDIPAFPAQWLERLMSRSPRERCTIAPVALRMADARTRSGRHITTRLDAQTAGARTTRFCRTLMAPVVCAMALLTVARPAKALRAGIISAHRRPARVRDDRDTPLVLGPGCRDTYALSEFR